jgi:hypothetical protein
MHMFDCIPSEIKEEIPAELIKLFLYCFDC